MSKRIGTSSRYTLLASLMTAGLSAYAQTPQTMPATGPAASEKSDVVVITGSLIKGTPEDAALPVDVLSTNDLKLQGSPSNVDIIKALPFIGATYAGDANPLGASRVQGAASINLRGLGNARTLVLLNGRRLAPITSGTQTLTDTNSLPMAAVGRVEVLKDGGAATYGSDAIAGVVNFITDTGFRGVELNGNYSFVDKSDGDYTLTAKWGFGNDSTDILLSAGYTHRSALNMIDRDWAYRPYLENPTGWATTGNPGTYSVGNTAGTAVNFVDPGCEAAGNQLTPLAAVGTARNCLMHYIGFENLVDPQDAFHVYGQADSDINDHLKLHVEGLYSQINLDEVATVGSSAIVNPPSATSTGSPAAGNIPGRFFIPATNPGLIDLLNRYTAADLGLTSAQYNSAKTVGVNALGSWRPIGIGGNPAFGGRSKFDHRYFTFYRLSGGFSGDKVLGWDIDWDLNSTFTSAEADSTGSDIIVSRLAYALRGLGGPNCTPGGSNAATSTPGVGPCQYFNPFSTGIERNALTGATNSGFVGHANSPDLVSWFQMPGGGDSTNQILTFDGLLSGKVTWFQLPGGTMNWAIGAQYRRNRTKLEVAPLSNLLINPCQDEGAPLSSCANDTRGVAGVFGPSVPRDYDQEVKAAFAELDLPLFDTLSAQLAVRTESHDAGDTTNPKIALRWEPVKGFAVRASAQSTYRAPPLAAVDPNISQVITAAVGTVRVPFDGQGNPNLQAETSDNYNVGFIVEQGPFKGTLDYWKFLLDGQIVLEDGPTLVNALFPATGPNNCGNPALAELQARFTFTNGVCSTIANISRVKRLSVNGPDVDAQGVDMSLSYNVGNLFGGDLTLGLDATYNLQYKVAEYRQFGILLTKAYDAVGLLNVGIDPRALPQLRGQFTANWSIGRQNVRWLTHYVSSVRDQRAGTGLVNDPLLPLAGFPAGTIDTLGITTGVTITHDLFYTWDILDSTTLTLSMVNIFDTDPPLTRNEPSYDPFTGSPLGRVIKVGVRQKF